MSDDDRTATDLDQEARAAQPRVAKTPSVEEALRRLTKDGGGEPVGATTQEPENETRVQVEERPQPERQPRIEFDPADDFPDAGLGVDDDDFDDMYDRIDVHLPVHRHVKRNLGSYAPIDSEPEAPEAGDELAMEPAYAPVVDVDVLLGALHGGDDEPLRRLSAIAIASEREAILASAKAEAQLLVSEARSHRRSIIAQAESKSEIMIARAEAQAAATVARAEARAQLLDLETRNQRMEISARKKRKQR
jgi:cell division septum initiation protein DivIVA